jgi:hypothetical protein
MLVPSGEYVQSIKKISSGGGGLDRLFLDL